MSAWATLTLSRLQATKFYDDVLGVVGQKRVADLGRGIVGFTRVFAAGWGRDSLIPCCLMFNASLAAIHTSLGACASLIFWDAITFTPLFLGFK